MKKLKFMVVALAMALLLGTGLAWSPTAQAIALSSTPISGADFSAFAGGLIGGFLYSTFDFAPATVPADGLVTSAVYSGIGDAAGLYVYFYSILHGFYSSEAAVQGISFPFLTNPTLTPVPWGVGSMTSFYDSGNYPAFADWTAGTISFGGSPDVPWLPRLGPGDDSFSYFGTFSPLPPGTVTAGLLGSGGTILSADVLTPVPEPATMMLLGSGLVGVAAFARRKWQARR